MTEQVAEKTVEKAAEKTRVRTQEALPQIKNIIRIFDVKLGQDAGKPVDEYLSVWTNRGYELVSAHYLGVYNANGMTGDRVLYIMKLRQP
jgi:hypothetical protein